MKRSHRHSLRAAATAALLSVPIAAEATDGYVAHGYGTKSKGMGGAGAALPQDSMATATNPAGMVFVGDRIDVGVALFSPMRSYRDDNPAAGFVSGPTVGQDSGEELFAIPHLAANWMIDDQSSLGFALYGNGGMNTRYAQGVYAGGMGGRTGVDLMQLFLAPTYARKVGSSASIAVSAILAAQRFSARGFSPFAFFSAHPDRLSNNGNDYSYGAGGRIGLQGDIAPWLTIGASATSRIRMQDFESYAGLFAEGGGFDIPAQATVGLAVRPNASSTITADVQHIWYSRIDSIANPLSQLGAACMPGIPASGAGCLGGPRGAGFGWNDMTILKLGYQWEASEDWTLRAGISHGRQPIPDDEVAFNIVAPAVMETHLTGGFTRKVGENGEFNLAAMYAPSSKVTGTVDTTALGGGVDTVSLEMKQFEIEASWGWRF